MAEEKTELLPKSKIGFSDLILAGVVKYFVERLAANYIGNGNIVSGAVKLGVAKFAGSKLPKPLKLALAIDGTEDIVLGVLGNMNFGFGNQNQSGGGNIFY
ncbi:MAG: hypothetical protein QW474_02245 [Candidatus Aenigmatarchaeota archaeon]